MFILPRSRYEHGGRGWYTEGFVAYLDDYTRHLTHKAVVPRYPGDPTYLAINDGYAIGATEEEAIANLNKLQESCPHVSCRSYCLFSEAKGKETIG